MKEEKWNEQSDIQEKKTYVKPVLSKVHLVAEQAVLGQCKFGTGSGVRTTCRSAGDLTCSSVPRS